MSQRPTSLSFVLSFSLAGFAAAQQSAVPAAPAARARLVPIPGQPATASGTTAAQPASSTALVEGATQAPQPAAAQDPTKQGADAAAQQKAQAATEQQQRIQQIRAVRFDRRGTTMLRTWATPKGEEVTAPGGNAAVEGNEAPSEGEPAQIEEVAALQSAPVQVVQATSVATTLALPTAVAPTAVAPTAIAPTAANEPPSAAPATQPGAAAVAPGANPADPQPAQRKPDPFAQSLKEWSRSVTLGDWPAVKTFLAGLATPEEKKAAWQHMLQSLRTPPPDNRPQAPNQPPATHRFGFDDVLGLIAAKPIPLDAMATAALGAILQTAVQRGNLTEPLMAALLREVQKPEAERALGQRDAVKLLLAAGLAAEAAEFLPKLEEAANSNDSEGLNLLAQSLVARNTKQGKAAFLEQAWAALQANFAAQTLDKKQKDEALRLAVTLAPRIKQELGKAWLEQSFTRDVQRGMDILASIGAAAAEVAATNANDAEFRKQTLLLQKTAVEALLTAAPARAKDWSLQLGILADNWLREAQQSYQLDQSASYFPQARRDRFGNFFYVDDSMQGGNNGRSSPAIKAADVLDLRPTAAWLGCVEDGLKPKFAMLIAQLWLKVQEETQAFPYIAELAKTHPKQANDLVNEFLRVWTRNHDPNAERRNYYFYGYEQRADGIPLTRSKQQRNLEELAKWVAQLRALPIGAIDENLLAKAFTTCHSSAEVYKLDAIQTVFGSLQDLKPSTLAALVEQMRGNLATVWRLPATQEQQKTKRKQKDIEQEVLRGYQVAIEVVEDGLQRHTGSWGLLLARAALRHDENDFRRELGNDTKFTQRRGDAFADFAAAAGAYQKQLPELLREQENVSVYEHWFYAALGSSELANVNHEQVVDQRQVEAVRDALKALPGDAGERHTAMFASGLFTKMSALKPAVKFRYLKAGLAVIGDHKQAAEAKKLFDYYQDLVTEIRLQTRVDGASAVAPDQPFGLFVDLRHTREIEREAGGFGRYLRNQNDVAYSFNYGRPTENYRDKFQEMCKAQLNENFDVLSVTFQTENVHSVATEEYGWRVTPYAYVMLKPRGPQIDRIPSLRLDLDFLDTSGYVVLPIESPVVPIDASKADAPARPVADVELTQILDERQSNDGKLKLEIKASGHGLMPPLAQLADLAPAGFAIAETEDSGPMVSRFDPENQTAIVSERTWNLTLRAKDGAELPRTFTFAKPKLDKTKLVYQRYADADLVTAEPEVALVGNYGKASPLRTWGLIGGAVALLAVGLALFRRGPQAATTPTGLQVPAKLTPFTVIGLLREIEALPGTNAAAKAELAAAIAQIEAGYFSASQTSPADLHSLATRWVEHANRAS